MECGKMENKKRTSQCPGSCQSTLEIFVDFTFAELLVWLQASRTSGSSHAMDPLIVYSMVAATTFIVVTGYTPTVLEMHRPYGIKMCKELCLNYNNSFLYLRETLTCRRVPSNYSIIHALSSKFQGKAVICPEKENMMNGRSCSLGVLSLDGSCTKTSKTSKDNTQTKPFVQQMSIASIVQTEKPAVSEHIPNITLHQACKKGKLGAVKHILLKGLEDINSRDKKGNTPAMTAALKGRNTVFIFLVNSGCDLLAKNDKRNNILHVACKGGNIDIVKELTDNKTIDIDIRGWHGWTPVMFAAYYGKKAIVEWLVLKGSNLTATDDREDTLLHAACLGGHVDIVKYIVTRNIVSLENRGFNGRTPVMSAIERGHVEAVKFLALSGCDMNVTDNAKNNILHTACTGGHVHMVDYVTKHYNVSIDSEGNGGRTPIMIAVMMGHAEVIDLLERKGCNLRTVSDLGNNILHFACISGHLDVISHVIKQNIFGIEKRGMKGRTAVLIAAEHGHKAVVELLIGEGSNPRVVDNDKNNILHLACRQGHLDIVKYIIKLNTVSIEERGFNGKTAFMIAVGKGQKDVADFLLLRGCKWLVVDTDNNTVLHAACYGGHLDMVKYILSKGLISVNVRGKLGRTPVMVAAERGHVGIINFLIGKGCDTKIVDENGDNTLHVACYRGHVNMVKYLIKDGHVSETDTNYHGKTPMQIAKANGHEDVISLFKTGQ